MTAEERFWSKVDKTTTPEGCWPWTASRLHAGYGQFGIGGKPSRAHRVAWELVNGPIPEGMWVLHHCDNPPCCNVEHLFLGTAADNNHDMIAKGRAGRADDYHPRHGERHHMTTLTEAEVRAIRARRAAGEKGRALAREFGVAESTVSMIVHGKNWVRA